MNNKDLFNAINDIDEKFIEDAGKYLSYDDSDDPLRSEAVEIFPGETRFSPIKLVASIAAAAVLITGVTIAVKHYRGKINIDANTGETASVGTAGVQGNSETNSGTDIGTHAVTAHGPLPFEVIGPNNRQLWYEDITSVERFVTGSELPDEPLLKEDLTEDNWFSLTSGFAYIAVPFGNNYNTIDNTPADINIKAGDLLAHEFKRVSPGNTFGELTVKKASSTITRLADNDNETDDGKVARVAALSNNYVEFEGSITADVYLINDGGTYYFVFRNGETQLPLIGYNIYDSLMFDEYRTEIFQINFTNVQYAGELPEMKLDENEKAGIEPYLGNANYLKAQITLENIKIEATQNLGSNVNEYSADISKIVFNYVDPVVSKNNLFGETTFTAENEMKIRAILGSADDISELKNNVEVMNLTDCKDIRVYRGNANMAGEFGEEISEGSLTPGMVIAFFNSEGERVAEYKCREAVLSE